MIVNLPSGVSQSRTIQSITGNKVTVTTAYSETPVVEAVWVIESDELYAQQYRVITVTDNNDGTFTIIGANHDPDKFDRIDTGAIIDQRPVSVIPPGKPVAACEHRDQLVFRGSAKYQRRNDARELGPGAERYRL
jgi:predicted phage tail protein